MEKSGAVVAVFGRWCGKREYASNVRSCGGVAGRFNDHEVEVHWQSTVLDRFEPSVVDLREMGVPVPDGWPAYSSVTVA